MYVKKVDNPFYFGHVMPSSSYAKADESGESEKATTSVEYGEVIKHPVFKKTDYGTELIFIGKDHDAMDAAIYFYMVKKPAAVPQAEETKGYNRFGILMGGDPKKINPLVPVLAHTSWLSVHVMTIMLGNVVVLVPDGYTGVPAESLGADWVVAHLADVANLFPPPGPLRHSA